MAANELIAIELQLKGYEGVMSDFRALDQMLNGFRGKKNKIEIQSDLANAKKEVIALQGELNKLKQIQYDLGNKGIKSDGLNNKIKETTQRLREAQQAVKEFQFALKNLQGMSFGQIFNKISSAVAHWGSAMQSAGNALTRLTNPFANFTKGMVMGAGYRALNKFTQGLESGFARSDTMRKYTRLMKEYETANYTAEQSRKELDDSVQGLPIALDDAVNLAQRYTLSLGDMERGTKLAIATNNAFLASMATDSQRYQGMLQMQDLLNGKKLNSREWMSLGASMGKAINEVGKELGYADENLGKFRQDLYAGKISTNDFLDALEKVGTGNGALVELAKQSMDTWEAFFSRVGTAASRMVYGILTSLDELVTTASGGKFSSLNALFDEYIIDGIDNMTASMKKWIKAHPDEIIEFGKALKSINWGSLIKGVGEGLLSVANLVKSFANMFGDANLSWIGRWMIKGNILGNALTIAGGLLKGSRHILAFFGASLFKGGQAIRNIKKFGGITGWLGSLLVGDNAEKATEAINTVDKVAPKMGKFSLGLSKLFKGWAEIAAMVGGSAFVGWASVKMIKDAFKDIKELGGIVSEIDWGSATTGLLLAADFITALIGVGNLIGNNPQLMKEVGIGTLVSGLLTVFASGTFWADMKLIKGGFKAIEDATVHIQNALNNLAKLASIKDSDAMKTKLKDAVALFNDITGIMQVKRNTPTGDIVGNLDEFDKKSAKTLKNISSAFESIKTALNSLNTINSIKINTDNVPAVLGELQHGLDMLGTALEEMPTVFKDNTASSWASKMTSTVQNFKTAFEGLIGKNGILAMIPKLVNGVSGLDATGALLKLPGRMKKLGNALEEVYTSLQGIGAGSYFASNIDNFRAGLKSLKFAIVHLQAISGMEVGDDVVEKVKGIISNISSAFNAEEISGIAETITTLKTSIEDALKSFEELNEPIEINPSIKLSNGFKQSVNSANKQIRSSRKSLEREINSIPSHYYKSITVHLSAHVVTSGINGAGGVASKGMAYARRLSSSFHSTGGYSTRQGTLYRSGGGSAFKPRGTDTIPAMLTPGEYVHRKQAVDFFGVDFMRKVNAMDVKGAMQSLLTKAGNATNIGRQSVVNNTVNNNQRITQNINTNNPNFATARMGRFVGAL